MRRWIVCASGVLALAPPLAAQHREGQAAGYVSAVHGRWLVYGGGLHGQQEVRPGMTVPAGAVIAFAGEGPDSASLRVRRFEGEPLVRECSADGGCGGPLRVEAGGHGTGRARRMMEAVASLLSGHAERYLPLISRRGNEGWTPAVVALRDDGVELGPVVAGTPGPLSLRLVPLAEAGGAPLDVAWTGGSDVARVPGARPGLYRLVSLRSPPRETWVLLLPPDRAAGARAELAEAAALVRGWGPDAWVEADTFLRAYLHHLSGEP
jgi:hypothetical protein